MGTAAKIYRPRFRKGASEDVFASLGIAPSSRPSDLVAAIRQGFPTAILEQVAAELSTTQQSILGATRIPAATLTRRRREGGKLTPQESDRVYRLLNVYQSAVQLFEGDKEAARRWIQQPARALAGNTPLTHLDTEAGADAVLDLIGRLEHGVVT